MKRAAAAIVVLAIFVVTSDAHYNMLLPSKPWAEKGEKVTFTYQFGHPYEHEMSDAPKPAGLVVFNPNGKKEVLDIDKTLTKIEILGADKKKVTAWQFDFTPMERGDYTFVLKTAKFKHDDNKMVEDLVKVVLHVQTQNGWDNRVVPFDAGLDIRPFTRPYGILPGMVFKGRVVRLPFIKSEPGVESPSDPDFGNGLPVEFEKYNAKPPKNLPPDELITFKTRVDPRGYFVASFPEPGWWGVTAASGQGQRATLWIHVDEKK